MASISIGSIEPGRSFTAERCVGDNDNTRGHANPIMDRAKSGRLFNSPEANLLAIQTLNRMDSLLSRAESENAYPGWLEGKADYDDDPGQTPTVQVDGRSAEAVIGDYFNGPIRVHERATARIPGKDGGVDIERAFCSTAQSGRFKFDQTGIIIGYRLNKRPMAGGDIWVDKKSPKFPDNVATPRDKKLKDHRLRNSARQSADDFAPPANDNFDERSCLKWLAARMAAEHYDAVYDATAGLGFGAIGEAAGFSGKQADAVGKDRVRCGIQTAARLLIEWDDASG